MLILTRRVKESLLIGDNVVITVISVNKNQVKLGINAPNETPVHRAEIYKRIIEDKGSIISLSKKQKQEIKNGP